MLNADHIIALAPDAQVATAGRKLAAPGNWSNLGTDGRALWGECKGSAVYKVKADMTDLVSNCSCPSRKFPCKHGVGLLLLCAGPNGMPANAAAPEWVSEWLAKRDKKAAQQAGGDGSGAAGGEAGDGPSVESESVAKKPRRRVAAKAADNRREEMLAGIAQFEQWLDDLVDQGLANTSNLRADVIERARRLVDAKAGGLAGQVQAIANEMSSATWTMAHTVAALGQCAMIADAFTRLDELPEELRHDIAAMTGIPTSEADVLETGQHVTDAWRVVATGQGTAGSVTEHRTWLRGVESGREALVLQFAPRRTAPKHKFAMGMVYRGEFAFYPGADGVRVAPVANLEIVGQWMPGGVARMGQEDVFERVRSASQPAPDATRFDGGTLDHMLDTWASNLSRQPLRSRMGYALSDVTPVDASAGNSTIVLRTRDGRRIAATCAAPLVLLCISGGWPVTVCGEWNGRYFEISSAFGSGRLVDLTQATGAKDTPSHVSVLGDDAGESATLGLAIAGVAGRGAAAVDVAAASDPVLASIRSQRPTLSPQRALLCAAAAAYPGSFDANIGDVEEFIAERCPVDSRPLVPEPALGIILGENPFGLSLGAVSELDQYQMPPDLLPRWFDGLSDKVGRLNLPPCLWPRAKWLEKQVKRLWARPNIRGMTNANVLSLTQGYSLVYMGEIVDAFLRDRTLGRTLVESCWANLDTDARWTALELLAQAPTEADRGLFTAVLENAVSHGQAFRKKGKPLKQNALPSRLGLFARDGLARLDKLTSTEALGALVKQNLVLAPVGGSKVGSMLKSMASSVTGDGGGKRKKDHFVEACEGVITAWYGDKRRDFRLDFAAPSELIDGVVLGDEAAEWPETDLPGLWVHVAVRRLPCEWWQRTYGLSAPELLMAMARSSHREELLTAMLAELGPSADQDWRGAVIGTAMLCTEKRTAELGVRAHLAAWTGDDATQGEFLIKVLDRNPLRNKVSSVVTCFKHAMPMKTAQRLTQWLLDRMQEKMDLGVTQSAEWVSLMPRKSLEGVIATIKACPFESIDWARHFDEPAEGYSDFKPHLLPLYHFGRCATKRLAIARALEATAPP